MQTCSTGKALTIKKSPKLKIKEDLMKNMHVHLLLVVYFIPKYVFILIVPMLLGHFVDSNNSLIVYWKAAKKC